MPSRVSHGVLPVSTSFLDVGLVRLDALCSAAGFPKRGQAEALRTLERMIAPWGQELVGELPRFPSDIGDDHFPLEFSIALGGGETEIRVLFEAQTASCRLGDMWSAGLALNELLQERYGASLESFKKIRDLFEPTAATARYAMWHAACFAATGDASFKIYLNPQARGKADARSATVEALHRLGFDQQARSLAAAASDCSELKFFSLDLDQGPEARAKVYKAHQAASRAAIEAELAQARNFERKALEPFWTAVVDHEGPFLGLPPTTYLSFTEGDERATSGTVHFPVRGYADDDRVVYERVTQLLDGAERTLYQRAIAAFAARPLEDGVGLHSYVAQRVGDRGRRVTIYLSPEGYRVAPRRNVASAPSRTFALPGSLSAAGFQGEVSTDLASRMRAARDVGGLVSKTPRAVLRPHSVEDLVRAVCVCRERRLPLVVRGQGRSPFGQSQIDDGVVLDTGSLDQIRSIAGLSMTVEAGATWKSVVLAATSKGLAPPVLTAFQGLSVGGTLSVGGISGTSYKRGAQIDQVFELEVVTGRGQLVTCSRERERELFDMVLGGLGQCAVIARAKIALTPTPQRVRHCRLRYASQAPFLDDMRQLAERSELDGLSGTLYLNRQDAPTLELNAVRFFHPGNEPDIASLLRDLSLPTAAAATRDLNYVDYYLEVDRLVDHLRATSAWDAAARPWFDVFLPDDAIDGYLARTLPELSALEDVGPEELGALGQLHLFPLLTQHLQSPMLRVPTGKLVFLFDILSSARSGADDAWGQRMVQRNRRLFERARAAGGTRYNIAAIPFDDQDWAAQLGPVKSQLLEQKQRHDPDGILNPGLGVLA